MDEIKKFEVGKTYYDRSACNHDCIFSYTVISRTAKTVILQDKFGKTRRRRVFISGGEEHVLPQGSYSMAPVLSAGRVYDDSADDSDQTTEEPEQDLPCNVIDFAAVKKKRDEEKALEAAKQKFLTEILPYLSQETLLNMATAAMRGDKECFRAEMALAVMEASIKKP